MFSVRLYIRILLQVVAIVLMAGLGVAGIVTGSHTGFRGSLYLSVADQFPCLLSQRIEPEDTAFPGCHRG